MVFIRAALLLIAFLQGFTAVRAAHPIMMDGHFGDWAEVLPLYRDAHGDGLPGGVDLLDISATNDSFALFIRFDLDHALLHHGNNALVLWIDGDNDSSTGYQTHGIGAELEWRFGSAVAVFHGIMSDTVHWSDVGLVVAPCYACSTFELCLDRHSRPGGAVLFAADSVSFALEDDVSGGDMAPDSGAALQYAFDDREGFVPEPLRLEREASSDLRIVTYNVLWDSPWSEVEPYRRILGALEPDIVAFQEIFSHDAEETAAWMTDLFPGIWYAARCGDDLVTVSRYPILATWQPGTEYAGAHLIGVPSRGDSLMLVLNLHLPWGTNDQGRQEAIDAVMAFLRDMMVPGSLPGIPQGTPIIMTGDTNMLGDPQQLDTMFQGDIADNTTHGPDFAPDWDGSFLEELISRQPNRRLAYTWYNESSPECPAHIDRFTYTGSVVEIANHFVLHTPLMDDALLALHGLAADDTQVASDHLPHVADIRLSPLDASDAIPRGTRVGVCPNPVRTGSIVRIESPSVTADLRLFDLSGRCVFRVEPGKLCKEARLSVSPGTYYIRSSDKPVRGSSLIVLPR